MSEERPPHRSMWTPGFTALAVGAVLLVGVLLVHDASSSSPSSHQAILRVTGAGTASTITEGTAAGFEQHNGRPLPYQDSVTVHAGDILTIGAQSSGSGKITCEILVGGAVVKSVTSEGSFATCTAAYVVT